MVSAMRWATMMGVIAVMLSGCMATLLSATAGQVGCYPGEISVTNQQYEPTGSMWTAECRGRRYLCTSTVNTTVWGPQTYGSGAQVSCALDYQGPTPGLAPGGCAYDTQCKGDRICQRGVCVEPGQAPPALSEPSGAPPAPPPPAAPDPALRRACLAQRLPDWDRASALEKKAALEACPAQAARP